MNYVEDGGRTRKSSTSLVIRRHTGSMEERRFERALSSKPCLRIVTGMFYLTIRGRGPRQEAFLKSVSNNTRRIASSASDQARGTSRVERNVITIHKGIPKGRLGLRASVIRRCQLRRATLPSSSPRDDLRRNKVSCKPKVGLCPQCPSMAIYSTDPLYTYSLYMIQHIREREL